jgi:hypothetical protein
LTDPRSGANGIRFHANSLECSILLLVSSVVDPDSLEMLDPDLDPMNMDAQNALNDPWARIQKRKPEMKEVGKSSGFSKAAHKTIT